ncbi:hypothetical protein C8F04DRAFT_1315836 [Mycena alexandri]|uniref:Uncharacterized protein n=1 Tax=Mycena alexandri TaxID=1745969 RepID=A0AAD6S810_9AGAR|nr:hypothetical protein C8F04DRAFT_1315836 [Mycena alexandri]
MFPSLTRQTSRAPGTSPQLPPRLGFPPTRPATAKPPAPSTLATPYPPPPPSKFGYPPLITTRRAHCNPSSAYSLVLGGLRRRRSQSQRPVSPRSLRPGSTPAAYAPTPPSHKRATRLPIAPPLAMTSAPLARNRRSCCSAGPPTCTSRSKEI